MSDTATFFAEVALCGIAAAAGLSAMYFSSCSGDRAESLCRLCVVVAGLAACAAVFLETGAIRLWRN